ncbi:MAG: hypothetical protein A2086_00550 [Spirochaetes bacterium GWD1_27_9]|nr:MAG: hypothetical protein A2Y34_03115 [Spirochaetes bacterium GWC1_27_15]OHD32500.1 MAG: hypothetical protein A2086_00550 [Spirochaetes bacterium GWD1_27_9]
MKYILKIIIFLSLIFSSSCLKEDKNSIEKNLFYQSLLQKKSQFSTTNELIEWALDIKKFYLELGETKKLIRFLGELSVTEKDPLFCSFLFFLISDLYWANDMKESSILYMMKIYRGAYFLTYENQPIGYVIALRIVNGDCSFNIKEKMYTLLLEEYKDIIDIPYTLYEFAKLYKQNYDMKTAIKIMQQIVDLSSKYKNIEENINLAEIKQEINFYLMKKNWIYGDLKTLINKIKYAIQTKNEFLLTQYVSKTGFKVILSQKTNQQSWDYNDLSIGERFSDRIIFSSNLEEFSSDSEAYLKTENWNFPQMTIWYFYFKKVDYPYDEKINGGWEWKGIYFGELF